MIICMETGFFETVECMVLKGNFWNTNGKTQNNYWKNTTSK